MQRAEQFRHAVDHAGERARVIREIELHCVVERDIVRVMSREIAQHLLLAPAEIAHQIVVPESVRICMIEQTPHGGRVDLALHGELRPPIEQSNTTSVIGMSSPVRLQQAFTYQIPPLHRRPLHSPRAPNRRAIFQFLHDHFPSLDISILPEVGLPLAHARLRCSKQWPGTCCTSMEHGITWRR